jgi:hypothetical protein
VPDVVEDPREKVSVRLSKPGLERVRQLALAETEGNESQMIRKLLAEAITARGRS